MGISTSSPGKGRFRRFGHRPFAMAAPPVVMILFAVSGRSISIPAAKAHVEPPARNATAEKTEPLVASVNPSYGSSLAPKLIGKRDPFRLPPPPPPPGAMSKLALKSSRPKAVLPPGPAGLQIDQLRLQGTVAENAGHRMIAIVTNDDDTDRAYFLQPNEAVFDGVVTQITPKAIHFRQRLQDVHGRESFREVVKRLTPRESQ